MKIQAVLLNDYRDSMFKGTSLLTFAPNTANSTNFGIRVPVADANLMEIGAQYDFEVKKSANQPPEV